MENLEEYSEHYLKSRQLAGPIITALVHNRPQSYAENNLLISPPQSTVECFSLSPTISTKLKDEMQPVEKTNCQEAITPNEIVCDYLKLIFQQNAMILDQLKTDKNDGMLPKPLIDHMKLAYATNMKLIELRSTWDSNMFESEKNINGHATDTDESTSADDNHRSNNPFKDSEINGNVASSSPPPSPTNNDAILKAQAYFFNAIEKKAINEISQEEQGAEGHARAPHCNVIMNGTSTPHIETLQNNGFQESNGIHDECGDEKQIKVEDDAKLKQMEKSKITSSSRFLNSSSCNTAKKGNKLAQDQSSEVIQVGKKNTLCVHHYNDVLICSIFNFHTFLNFISSFEHSD